VDEMREATFIEEIMRDKLEAERAEIMQQGIRQASYEHVLDVLAARFSPPVMQYRQIERRLKKIPDTEQLRRLLLTLVQADELSAFEQALEQIVPEQAAQKDEWLYPTAQAG